VINSNHGFDDGKVFSAIPELHDKTDDFYAGNHPDVFDIVGEDYHITSFQE
jgi:hypothetical protein